MAVRLRHLILIASKKGPEMKVGKRKHLALSPTHRMKLLCGINLMRATDNNNEDVRN